MGFKLIFLAIFWFGTLFTLAAPEPIEDKLALLDFLRKIAHSRPLNWDENTSSCTNWTGVTCSHDKSRIVAVHLPQIAFHGPIPPNTLSRLSALQILSMRSNGISGPFPSDLSKLGNLTAIYFQFNNFSGSLPSDFSVWKNLSAINLSNNFFSGSIPSSISNLRRLTALNLANNSLSGEIPDIKAPTLQLLNLSNNNLSGRVPQSLWRFPSWAFVGNNLSAEKLSPSHLPVLPSNAKVKPSKKSRKLGESAMLGIIIGSCSLGFVAFAALLFFCYSSKKGDNGLSAKDQSKEGSENKPASGSQDGSTKLVFFEGCSIAFDLEDLLRASAEVLGKGTCGTTYKAALEDATTVVVKRLKELSMARRDFEQQMQVVGNVRHENVVALSAYYYSKDEKLMVYEYHNQGSVSAMLHARRGENRPPLDWETRLRIAIGAARGIAHIHTHNGGRLFHGNIKASNIFLNSQRFGCVSDLGLATLMSTMAPPVMQPAGYRAPEVAATRKTSQASDVYSFGVLLFELLTGKSPTHATTGNEVVHLVRWVNSVVREEWTAEVFDVELLRYPSIEEEMVEMLQIGMACVARAPEQRPKMLEVVKMVEDIRTSNAGSQPSSGTKSLDATPPLTPPASDIV